ncbi:BRIX1 [Cordylochernes scorpioides]|uniref:Ribosome biogenesis protein BRX1 homolog n=1 Tax=Cordylochernes scorpioides TaxID=51811 RepID=A0ABY6LGK7_9ARAC|nr:BRIX1 [Cordylochernes scorpioides]
MKRMASQKKTSPLKTKVKWINKQRVLVFCSQGIRHTPLNLMKNLRTLLPHSKSVSHERPKPNTTAKAGLFWRLIVYHQRLSPRDLADITVSRGDQVISTVSFVKDKKVTKLGRPSNEHQNNVLANIQTAIVKPKMDKKDPVREINEICAGRNCNKCIYFEQKRHDLYLWVSNVPNGPSAKFLVENIKSMEDLYLTGNCLRGGQSLIGFNKKHLQVLKELFTQVLPFTVQEIFHGFFITI